MKYIDEYRDPKLARALVTAIRSCTTRRWVLMEICGGQTHTLMRYGIDDLLPYEVELVHGPGCPVCVTSLEVINKAVAIASTPGVILASYGDMLRVPGSKGNLLRVKALGGDIRIVYSPLDALKLARINPDRKVVFFAVGFETTAPANATAVWQARREGLANFSMLASHVLVAPAIRLLLASPWNRVQGLIAPGHVCAVTGYAPYEEIARHYRVPVVVGGFEPLDLLEAILMLVKQLEAGIFLVANQYARGVTRWGNQAAQQRMSEVFEVCDQVWRGIGPVPASGLRLRPEYSAFDAEKLFPVDAIHTEEPKQCISSQILQGLKRPTDCPEFGKRCTPEQPMGAPMVSSEGACSAYYHYRRHAIPNAAAAHQASS